MRVVIQRVKNASVRVPEEDYEASVSAGLLVLAAFEADDNDRDIEWMSKKICALRIFDDENGVMNLSVRDTGGEILCISQFTLSADVYHGNRPSFDSAEEPEKAKSVYEKGIAILKNLGINVQCGIFGAHMEISYINDGPVTFVLDSACFSHRS